MTSRSLSSMTAFGAGFLGLLLLSSPVHRVGAAPVPKEVKEACYECNQCAEISGSGYVDLEGGGMSWVGYVQLVGTEWVPAYTAAGSPFGIQVRGAHCIDSEAEVVPQSVGYYEQIYGFGQFRCTGPVVLQRVSARDFITPIGDPTGDPDDDPWTQQRCPPSNTTLDSP